MNFFLKSNLKNFIRKKLRVFLKTSPTRHIKYKVTDFAPINK